MKAILKGKKTKKTIVGIPIAMKPADEVSVFKYLFIYLIDRFIHVVGKSSRDDKAESDILISFTMAMFWKVTKRLK